MLIKELNLNFDKYTTEKKIIIKGWIKTIRVSKGIAFFEINDSSVKCLYGITVGMERKVLESILGPLKKGKNSGGDLYYCQELGGRMKYIYFNFEGCSYYLMK